MTCMSRSLIRYLCSFHCVGFLVGALAAVCIYREIVEEKRERSASSAEFDYESLSRVPTIDLIERSGIGGAGAVFPPTHKRTLSGSSERGIALSNFGNAQSAPGSPSTVLNRKGLLTSPYASPVKGARPGTSGSSSSSSSSSSVMGIAETGGALFKSIIESRPFQGGSPQQQRGAYENIADRES